MIDKGQVFCTAQAFSATGFSTDSIPITTARKLFQGEPLCYFWQVSVAADLADGNETYQFEAHTDSSAGMGTATQLITRAISRTVLLANTIWSLPVPNEVTLSTFLGFKLTLGGTTPSITIGLAWLGAQKDADQWTAYADAITIS